jgi:predicted nucleic acid-binding Zn ribbon protein
MQRASQIIGRISSTPKRSSHPSPVLDPEQVACAAWERAVGAKLAKHTRAAKLVRGRLVVEVEDETWKRNLFSLSRHVMANLEKSIGAGIVTDIEFRVLPRRREPQRAQTLELSAPPVAADDADEIQDPVLRRLYRSSRSKLA